jgi:ADP-ribosylglycohydrolase
MGEVEKRCLGLIFGCAVGDAKGIPVENKTKKEIEKYFETHSKKELYLKCEDHPFIGENFLPGCWTDDTQLTLAMCRSFISSKKFDMNSIVKEHVFEHQRSLEGWGGTRNAIKRFFCQLLIKIVGKNSHL